MEWGTLGRLKPDDIPTAAVDFHISSIIEELLGKPHVIATATKAAAKLGMDPAAALKSAMWHFSGSCNHRSMLQVLPPPMPWECFIQQHLLTCLILITEDS